LCRRHAGSDQEVFMSDENVIRDTIEAWLRASKEGDSAALSSILDDDVLFVVAGQAPFGKKEFFAGQGGKPFRFEAKADIREVIVHGDWALTRVELEIEMTAAEGSQAMKLAGPTMSVWRKTPGGRWVIWRDANMVGPAGS
jgi:uncharacterized protein (TIGR02246 family)